MAETAAGSSTKIGSLYRFLPNKERLADPIVVSVRENLDAVFDRFDRNVNVLSIRTLAAAAEGRQARDLKRSGPHALGPDFLHGLHPEEQQEPQEKATVAT